MLAVDVIVIQMGTNEAILERHYNYLKPLLSKKMNMGS
jgi:hypothetical protein